MISIDRAREILAQDGHDLPDEQIARLLDDLYAVGRVIVSAYRKPARIRALAGASRFSAEDQR